MYSKWQHCCCAAAQLQALQLEALEHVPLDGEIDADGAVNFSHMVTVAGQHSGSLPYNQRELQRYILLCAQQTDGGLRDKLVLHVSTSSCLILSSSACAKLQHACTKDQLCSN
eukprot:7019-Heterococcus_DN1.PRE.7